jgi:hypothetical protein
MTKTTTRPTTRPTTKAEIVVDDDDDFGHFDTRG